MASPNNTIRGGNIMFFYDPFLNDYSFDISNTIKTDTIKENAVKEKSMQNKNTVSEDKPMTNNLAKELADITKKNTKLKITEDITTWNSCMKDVYNNIIVGCLSAANKGKNSYTYEHNVLRQKDWITLGQFDIICKRLENVDGLKIKMSHYNNSGIVITNEDMSMNVSFKITCTW